MKNPNYWHHETKALGVSVFLLIVGALSWVIFGTSVPLLLFYLALTLNSYYSIRFFASLIPPEDSVQLTMDFILIILYVLLAFHLAKPLFFVGIMLAIFLAAAMKYTLLLNTIPHPRTLRYKLVIDITGATWCLLALAGILAGYVSLTLWVFTLGFLGTNIYVLFMEPMYRSKEL